MGILSSTLFARGEITNSSKWYLRVWKPISDALLLIWGNYNTWQNVTMQNAWVADLTTTYGTPAWRVRDGVLFVRGAIKSGAVNTVAFNISLWGATIGEQVMVTMPTTNGGAARVDINANGDVVVVSVSSGSTTNIYLNIAVHVGTIGFVPVLPTVGEPTMDLDAIFPITTPPVANGKTANQVRWWRKFFSPVSQAIDKVLADVTPTQFVASMSNGWSNFGSGWTSARYTKRRGVVYVKGLVVGGTTVPGTIFTLPVGFRPLYGQIFLAWSGAGLARVDVLKTGEVYVQNYIAGGNNLYLTLSDVKFFAEQ